MAKLNYFTIIGIVRFMSLCILLVNLKFEVDQFKTKLNIPKQFKSFYSSGCVCLSVNQSHPSASCMFR